MDIFPDNVISSFVTKLPEEVNLSGEWEVGLKELQYPQSWYSLNGSEGEFLIDLHHLNSQEITNVLSPNILRHRTFGCMVYPGYYASPQQLCDTFNEVVRRSLPNVLRECITVTYSAVSGKFTIVLHHGVRVTLGRSLARMFGLRKQLNMSQRSKTVADLRRGVYSMYVYCNVCREVVVGDTKVPLLRIVPITGQHGDYVCQVYDFPTYTPLQRKNFSDVKIDIRDDTGRKIPFQSGKVTVTLHFRKRGLLFQ